MRYMWIKEEKDGGIVGKILTQAEYQAIMEDGELVRRPVMVLGWLEHREFFRQLSVATHRNQGMEAAVQKWKARIERMEDARAKEKGKEHQKMEPGQVLNTQFLKKYNDQDGQWQCIQTIVLETPGSYELFQVAFEEVQRRFSGDNCRRIYCTGKYWLSEVDVTDQQVYMLPEYLQVGFSENGPYEII